MSVAYYLDQFIALFYFLNKFLTNKAEKFFKENPDRKLSIPNLFIFLFGPKMVVYFFGEKLILKLSVS